jgi:F-type H+-transporting ATPase subunit epsilon
MTTQSGGAQEQEQAQSGQRTLHVTIVTGERIVYDGGADALTAPALWGAITILPDHAPLLAILEPGELDIRLGRQEENLAVGGGFCEVLDNEVIVLADTAERATEIDAERAEAARARAQMLARRYRDRPEIAAGHRQALLRNRARLRVARKAARRR